MNKLITDKNGKPLKGKYQVVAQERHDGCQCYDLANSFVWSDTPEGGDFWRSVNKGETPSFPRVKPVHCGYDIGGTHYGPDGVDGFDVEMRDALMNKATAERDELNENLRAMRQQEKTLARLAEKTNNWK